MKKPFTLLALALCLSGPLSACPLCNRQVKDAVYDSQFYPNLLVMLSPFIVLSVIVVALTALSTRSHKARLAANPGAVVLSPVPLTTASVVLGIGFGGFVDGIVLHQILQVHEMLSNKIPATDYVGKSVNMFWDGIFHAFCLLVVIVGVTLLWKLLGRKDADCSAKLLAAGGLMGWGTFNLVEGVLNHQILELHNVIEYASDHAPGNYAFLGASLVMLIAGWGLFRSESRKRYAV